MSEVTISSAHPIDIESFLITLNSAETVLTTAMHCYIACLSYGIPCALLNFSSKSEAIYGDGIKYLDAMEGIGLSSYPPHCIDSNLNRVNIEDYVDNRKLDRERLDQLKQHFLSSIQEAFS